MDETNLLLLEILEELKKITEYIEFLKWEEMCKREICKKLPIDKLNPEQKEEYSISPDECIEKMQSKFEDQLEKWSKSKSASCLE